MAVDSPHTTRFYGSARGAMAARLVRERLALIWPDLRGQSVMGLGYCAPYLRLWRQQAARCVAVTPVQAGFVRWPGDGPSLTCLVEEDALPFPDLSFDRVLLVHGLEVADNARRLLREAWRVLKDDGKLLAVVPNRTGMWAYWESNPFGHGQPYSVGQLDRLLTGTLFRVEQRDTALYVPPADWRLLRRFGPLCERTGRRLVPGLAGVTLTEAVKELYAAMPVKPVTRRRLVLAEAA